MCKCEDIPKVFPFFKQGQTGYYLPDMLDDNHSAQSFGYKDKGWSVGVEIRYRAEDETIPLGQEEREWSHGSLFPTQNMLH